MTWEGAAAILVSVSIVTLLLSFLLLPKIIISLPSDYFVSETRHRKIQSMWILVLKNGIGVLLTVLGLLMLFTPGQGLLTILAGLILLDFPKKYVLERNLVKQKGVLHALNWIRRKAHVDDLIDPHAS